MFVPVLPHWQLYPTPASSMPRFSRIELAKAGTSGGWMAPESRARPYQDQGQYSVPIPKPNLDVLAARVG